MCPPIENLGIAIDWHIVARTSNTTDGSLRTSQWSHGEQEPFGIALAEAKTEVQPDTIADDLHGEAVVFIAVGWNGGVHATIMAHRPGAV